MNMKLKNCACRLENGNCSVIGGFCTSVPKEYCDIAIEIHQYCSIGTVEQIKEQILLAKVGDILLKQYQEIGTVEECRKARERQKAKKPVLYKGTNRADCPSCGGTVRGIDKPFGNWCSCCGQAIDWSGRREGAGSNA